MADYTITPSYIYNEEINNRTQIISMEDGGENRNSYGAPRRTFILNYDRITKTIKDSIVTFFTARIGRYETFNWLNPNDSITYIVRFIDETLETEEIVDDVWNVKLKLFEVI